MIFSEHLLTGGGGGSTTDEDNLPASNNGARPLTAATLPITDRLDVTFAACSDTAADAFVAFVRTVLDVRTTLDPPITHTDSDARAQNACRVKCLVSPSNVLGTCVPECSRLPAISDTCDQEDEAVNCKRRDGGDVVVVLIPYEMVRWLLQPMQLSAATAAARLASKILIASSIAHAVEVLATPAAIESTIPPQQLEAHRIWCMVSMIHAFKSNTFASSEPPSGDDAWSLLFQQLLIGGKHKSDDALSSLYRVSWMALLVVAFSPRDTLKRLVGNALPLSPTIGDAPNSQHDSLDEMAPPSQRLHRRPFICVEVDSVKTSMCLSRVTLALTHNLHRADVKLLCRLLGEDSCNNCTDHRLQIPVLIAFVNKTKLMSSNFVEDDAVTITNASIQWSPQMSIVDDDATVSDDRALRSHRHYGGRVGLEKRRVTETQTVGVFHEPVENIAMFGKPSLSPLVGLVLPHPRWSWAAAAGLVDLSRSRCGTASSDAETMAVCWQRLLLKFRSASLRDVVLPQQTAADCTDHQWSGMIEFLAQRCAGGSE